MLTDEERKERKRLYNQEYRKTHKRKRRKFSRIHPNEPPRYRRISNEQIEIARKALESDGLSYQQAADLIGVHKTTLYRLRDKYDWKAPFEKFVEKNAELSKEGRKICTRCLEDNGLDGFQSYTSRKGELLRRAHCKSCHSAITIKWRLDNPEKALILKNKKWVVKKTPHKLELKRLWYCKNKAKMAACLRARYLKNPEPFIRKSLERANKLKELQTPAYVDQKSINIIYREMSRRNKECGSVEYHVDHIIPLNGERVSGLHIETNLRIIKAKDNTKKSNSFTPCSDSKIQPNELEISPHLFPKQLERIYA